MQLIHQAQADGEFAQARHAMLKRTRIIVNFARIWRFIGEIHSRFEQRKLTDRTRGPFDARRRDGFSALQWPYEEARRTELKTDAAKLAQCFTRFRKVRRQ
jgi:hypothetical protein